MAYTTIDLPTDYFNTKLYTGTGSSNSITGVGFQPDWVWIKNRDTTNTHEAFDSVRGATKTLYPDRADAEYVNTSGSLTSFNSDGFTVGGGDGANKSGSGIVSWNWKAGTSFTNDASATGVGSIDSAGSISTDAGFAIISWTGSGSAATIAHGLGSKLSMYIVKNRTDNGEDWIVYHGANTSAPETDYIMLNQTNATGDSSGVWNDTAPTSSVFSVGTANSTNGSSKNMIAYCFAEKKGYSKFGSYTGNGGSSGVSNADGTFVFTGFSPAWVMIKRSDSAQQWGIVDSKRDVDNPAQHHLFAESNQAEGGASSYNNFDLLSNGFKLRSGDQWTNASGGTYIYMAFAESPFVTSTGIPTTAR